MKLGITLTPAQALSLAVTRAKRGAGAVAPNPLVGCVILDREFKLLSLGYHTAVGKAHAEVEALHAIRDQSKLEGAHVFVTLEPCAHEGRTPSCAKNLAKLPIQSVTYGLEDPNPLVSGQGAEILKAAGKQVLCLSDATFEEMGLDTLAELRDLQWQMEEVAEIFLHNFRTRMPFVALKVATSLDGQMGLKSGESKWITNELSRAHTHVLRAGYDAICVGRRTFELDNPALNIRIDGKEVANRVVLIDPTAATLDQLPESRLWQVRKPEQVTIIVESSALKSKPKLRVPEENVIAVERLANGKLSLKQALTFLFQHRITSLFVEGGGYTLSQFLEQRLAQRLYLFQAPIIVGSGGGVSWTQNLAIENLKESLELEHVETQAFDGDQFITGRFTARKSQSSS